MNDAPQSPARNVSACGLGPRQRVVRVFVSSTFRDMHAERDELARHVFPQLRKLCEQRGVTWTDVDLRWGITDEQAAEGKVLPICLAEIQNCRPFFIGLLGERYGWVPQEIPPDLINQEPWLAEHRGHSVTELEILHGVLNDPQMANRACFYFRDPSYVDQIPDGQKGDFIEEDPAKCQKLARLKDRIRRSGLALREDYPDPRTLGQWVLDDLTVAVNQEFPPGTEPDLLARGSAEHEAFAQSRAGVYIGRQEYFDRLDEHARGTDDGPGLVVLGESGVGKSALLANWAIRRRREQGDELLVMHFIGASAYSADWAAMLRRIMGQLKHRFKIEQDIPDDPGELRAGFANWLHMAAARGRVVLILDALNQLEDRHGAPDLVWLPPVMPGNIRLIVSTLPGRPLDELARRGWPALTVQPFEQAERRQFIAEYLAQYTKSMAPQRAARIAAAPQAANPLYLQGLLEELRVVGAHERLDEQIDGYLAAENVPELYEKVLARYEHDYQRDRPGLVGDAMTALWAARRGLSEAELLDLLGTDDGPMPRAHFSPLHFAADRSLVSRSGLITFAHDYLRRAVRRRYLPTPDEQAAAHLRLADYFEPQELSLRKIDELPWQMAQAGAWDLLYALLADLDFLMLAWLLSSLDVKAYWAQIEANSELHMVDAYRPVLEDPASHIAYASDIAVLLDQTGHPGEALSLREVLVAHYSRSGDWADLQGSLGNQALSLKARGDVEQAMGLLEDQERICRQKGHEEGLQAALGNRAVVLRDRGDLDGAMALHGEQERICRRLGHRAGLMQCLANQGLVLRTRGDLGKALALHEEAERICRELGDMASLHTILGNHALILTDRGELAAAEAMHEEQERICRELGDKAGLQVSLGDRATILRDRGDLDRAMALHREQEQICRELGEKAGLARSLGGQAAVLGLWGDLDAAMALRGEEGRICRELGYKAGLARSLGEQAIIVGTLGDPDGAMALHKEAEGIFRELGDRGSLSASLSNQAWILKDRGELDRAFALFQDAGRICRELGKKGGLSASLSGQASILKARGDLDGAMRLYKDQEQICRELADRDGLAKSLGSQAMILRAHGDLDEATALFRDAEHIFRDVGDKGGIGACVGERATILWHQGDLDGAMALLKEKERLSREMGNKHELGVSLGNQAGILQALGDLEAARALFEQEERIWRELGAPQPLAISLRNQAVVLATRMGRPAEALALLEEAHVLAAESGFTVLARDIEQAKKAIQSHGHWLMAAPEARVTAEPAAAGEAAGTKAEGFDAEGQRLAAQSARSHLEAGNPARALEELQKLRGTTAAAQNLRGVCYLRLGDAERAIEIFRELVFSPSAVTLLDGAPLAYKTNFVTSLLMLGNISGAKLYLDQIDAEDHPIVRRLRSAVQEWKKGLPRWRRLLWACLGIPPRDPVPLGFPPGDLPEE